jgi:hypothetical protein
VSTLVSIVNCPVNCSRVPPWFAAIFGDVKPCSLVEFTDVSEEPQCLVFHPEDGRPGFLQNNEKFPPDYKCHSPNDNKLSLVPFHAHSMEQSPCEATVPQLVKKIPHI